MRKITLFSTAALFLFACKKEPIVPCTHEEEQKVITQSYIPTVTQHTIDVWYVATTKNKSYNIYYTVFEGFNSDGSPIALRKEKLNVNGTDTIKFKVVTSPFGNKYHYECNTLSNKADSLKLQVFINGAGQSWRPNYGSVFNFISYEY